MQGIKSLPTPSSHHARLSATDLDARFSKLSSVSTPLTPQRQAGRASSVPHVDMYWLYEHNLRSVRMGGSACPSPTTSISTTCSSAFSPLSSASSLELRSIGLARAGSPIRSRDSRVRINKSGFTRSRTGCLTCRSQKKKCDEMKPICTRCKNNQHCCRYPDQREPLLPAERFEMVYPADFAAARSSRGLRAVSGDRYDDPWLLQRTHSSSPDSKIAFKHKTLYERSQLQDSEGPASVPQDPLSALSMLAKSTELVLKLDGEKTQAGQTASRTSCPGDGDSDGDVEGSSELGGDRTKKIDPSRILPPLPPAWKLAEAQSNATHATSATLSPFALSASTFWSPSKPQACPRSMCAPLEAERVVLPPITAFDKPSPLLERARIS